MRQLPIGIDELRPSSLWQSRRIAIVISTFAEVETKPSFIDSDIQLYSCELR